MPNPKTARFDICRLDEMPENGARGFEVTGADGEPLNIIVWRDAETVRGFVNKCPHLGLPLETFPDRFLSKDGSTLICSAHGARFNRAGTCTSGPCQGVALTQLDIHLAERDAKLMIVLTGPPGHS